MKSAKSEEDCWYVDEVIRGLGGVINRDFAIKLVAGVLYGLFGT